MECLELDPSLVDGSEEGTNAFPGSSAETFRALDVRFGPFLSLDGHFCKPTHRTEVRQGVMARVAHAIRGFGRTC